MARQFHLSCARARPYGGCARIASCVGRVVFVASDGRGHAAFTFEDGPVAQKTEHSL